MIEFAGVSKVYTAAGGEVRAVDDISLTIDDGEFVTVRGHSGSGKSTLLSLAGGLALPTTGEVTVAGQPLSRLSASERARFRSESVGFVFQMFHLLPYLSVLDNVLVASCNGKHGVEERAKEILERFGLSPRIDHRPGQLSAGERQRVAMARALLNQPKLILADEPTGNLDPQNAAAVLDLLAEFHVAGGTILLVTHDEIATGYAQRIISLQSGRIADAISA